MAEYIKREDAINAIEKLPTWWADEGGYYGGMQQPRVALLEPEDVINAIKNIPSEDVVEVRHGKWEKVMCVEEHPKYTSYNPEWFCSECGQKYKPEFAQIVHFCYRCGTRMDGE